MLKRRGAVVVIKKTEIFSRTGRIKLVWEAIPHTRQVRLGKHHGLSGMRVRYRNSHGPEAAFFWSVARGAKEEKTSERAQARSLPTTGHEGP